MASKPWEHAKSSGSEGDPLAARFVASLPFDKRLYDVDLRGSLAHARMLEHVGLIDGDELQAIEDGLEAIRGEIEEQGDAWPGWRIELEDVHMCIEAALIEKAGDAGRKLHTGRSRNDQVALDLVEWIGEATHGVQQRHIEVVEAFVALAERYGRVVMPSYTHLQRAQPIVVGGEVAAWVEALSRCGERYSGLLAESETFPLGSGAIAGSSLPLDREHTARLLGYEDHPDLEPIIANAYVKDRLSRSSIDATASRDAAVDFVYALSMTAMTLSRWAEQWIIYASTEFGFITLDDLYTTGSSMMPQKQNPDMLELIRGKTGGVYGNLVALLTMLKGLPIGYNRDLQEDKRHVFSAYDDVCDMLDMAAKIVRTTTFNEERIKQGLDRGFLDATSLAEYLVTRGVPFRTAHQVVGALVKRCTASGRHKLEQLGVEEMNAAVGEHGAGQMFAGLPEPPVGEDVYGWLGPENVVKRYQTYGNAGVSGFEQQLAEWKSRLGDS